jgi:hypothetical protein
MNEKVKSLNEEAIRVAGIYNRCEAELISILQEFDKYRGYLHFGCTSLHGYCVEVLKLSEATAYNFTSVCRKSVQVPELKTAIESGELTLSKARKIVPVLTKENHDEWLSLAKTSTTREIEKAVAKVQPQTLVKETAKYVAEDLLAVTLGFSEEEIKLLKRVMDLESQKTKSATSRKDAIVAGLRAYIEKNDPLKKAERAVARANKIESTNAVVAAKTSTQRVRQPVTGQVLRRPALPAAIIHAVHIRDQRQCTHTQNNKRCGATRWLDIHHIVPRSYGGKDTFENLTTVCSAHHRFIHQAHQD